MRNAFRRLLPVLNLARSLFVLLVTFRWSEIPLTIAMMRIASTAEMVVDEKEIAHELALEKIIEEYGPIDEPGYYEYTIEDGKVVKVEKKIDGR